VRRVVAIGQAVVILARLPILNSGSRIKHMLTLRAEVLRFRSAIEAVRRDMQIVHAAVLPQLRPKELALFDV